VDIDYGEVRFILEGSPATFRAARLPTLERVRLCAVHPTGLLPAYPHRLVVICDWLYVERVAN